MNRIIQRKIKGGIYLKLTILGCYGPYPKAGGACSGYLLEDETTKILIDCGNGVLSRLFLHFLQTPSTLMN